MYVADFVTDEGFIDFHVAARFTAILALLRKPNFMEHEPCGLLSYSERSSDFTLTNSVLGIQDKPRGGKPLTKVD